MHYYIKKKNQTKVHGPYTGEQIIHFAQQSKLDNSYFISTDTQNWSVAVTQEIFPLRYKILSELGRGGMGVVYKAQDLLLKRYCALKIVEKNHSETPLQFQEEAAAMARLQHPNIVTVYDTGTFPLCFLSMELVEGITLKKWLQSKHSEKEYLSFFHQICQAIEYAHNNNVVHRDIKPENIMLSANGVKVMDFGIARQLDTNYTLQKTGNIMGTPQYMAPEMIQGQKADKRSDIYALGVILYQMLTGRLPYEEDEVIGLFFAIMNTDPPQPSLINPRVNKDLEVVCMHCIEAKREHRYQQVRELREEIERVQQNHPIKTRPASIITKIKKYGFRHPVRVFILLAVPLISLILFTQNIELRRAKQREILQNKQQQKTTLEKQDSLVFAHMTIASNSIALQKHREAIPPLRKAFSELQNIYQHMPQNHIDENLHNKFELYQQNIVLLTQNSLPNILFPQKKIKIPSSHLIRYYQAFAQFSSDGELFAEIMPHPQEGRGRLLCWKIKDGEDCTLNNAFFDIICDESPIQFKHDASGIYYIDRGLLFFWNFHSQTRRQVKNIKTKLPHLKNFVIAANEEYFAYLAVVKEDQLVIYGQNNEFTSQNGDLLQIKGEITISADSKLLAGVAVGGMFIWNLEKKTFIKKNTNDWRDTPKNIIFSPSRRHVIYNEHMGDLFLYDFLGNQKVTLSAHENQIQDIVFSNDDRFFCSCGLDKKIILWNSLFHKISEFSLDEIPRKAIFDSQQNIVLLLDAQTDFFLQRWTKQQYVRKYTAHPTTHELIRHFRNKNTAAQSNFVLQKPAVISPKGTYIVQPFHFRFMLWENDKPCSLIHDFNHREDFVTLRFSHDEKFLANLQESGELLLLDMSTKKMEQLLQLKRGHNKHLSFSFDNKHIFVSDIDSLRIWDIATKTQINVTTNERYFLCVEESPDKKWLACSYSDGSIELWQGKYIEGKKNIFHTFHAKGLIRKIVWHKQAKVFATVTEDGTINTWQYENNKWRHAETYSYPYKIRYLFFAPDARYFAVTTHRKTMVFDRQTREKYELFSGYFKGCGVFIYPDWKQVAIPSVHGDILIYKIPQPQDAIDFLNHKNQEK